MNIYYTDTSLTAKKSPLSQQIRVHQGQVSRKRCTDSRGNFVELAEKGFYNGLKFHRHEPNFVIQGGCPNTRDLTPEQVKNGYPGLGTGNPGYSIKGEWTTNPNNRHQDGTLAMARSSSPDSAGSQFYFCLGSQAFLDGNYTVFGDPVDQESMDVIHSLRKGDEILSIEIENKD